MSSGLLYPDSFLESLPPISSPCSSNPIRVITPAQFAHLHGRHLLATGKPGLDAILFPYLHGTEHGGRNMQEYFSTASGSKERDVATLSPDRLSDRQDDGPKPSIPAYRGLVWVACDEGDEDGHPYADDGLDEEMLVDDDELNIRRPSDASTTSVQSGFSLLRSSTSTPSPTSTEMELPDDVTMVDELSSDRSEPVVVPCSLKASDILYSSCDEFLAPKVPELVSLRNFGIQINAYSRISDIVVYSPSSSGLSHAQLSLAQRLAAAHERLYQERQSLCSEVGLCPTRYNIFVLTSHPSQLPEHMLTPVPPFAQLEMQEMQILTHATEILPGIFLGNSSDVPIWSSHEAGVNVFDNSNNPSGYDLVVECADGNASVPSPSHIKRAEDHLHTLQSLWATGFMSTPPARPAPNAHSILHLPFPSSPSQQTPNNHISNFVQFIQNLLHPQHSSRRAKVLIYGHDGYTETSVLALILIMAERKCTLPEAYLELQVKKERSFFVHQSDLAVLRKMEVKYSGVSHGSLGRAMGRSKERNDKDRSGWHWNAFGKNSQPNDLAVPSPSSGLGIKFGKRPNAPAIPSSYDNSTWFNHPRFDGSFPSRVLPFLYLGNLNHAVNAHMLHALGITHVVSVGECAIEQPDESMAFPGRPVGYGSLWLEEKEGRIRVLDIKNLSDDGVDSLLPQMGTVCDWIESARREGGRILVHCRVGVSRSATVTIAYLMRHLDLPLVDSYLIVRSRRLSVLIQPNMRLLFNLLGWEVQVAQSKAKLVSDSVTPSQGGLLCPTEESVVKSLSRSLPWPFLAREIHRLNAKYIR